MPSSFKTGAIPTELGGMLNMESLGLGNDDLSGSIPSQLGMMLVLNGLHVFNNDLSGNLIIEMNIISTRLIHPHRLRE
jgi:hypothetical protein